MSKGHGAGSSVCDSGDTVPAPAPPRRVRMNQGAGSDGPWRAVGRWPGLALALFWVGQVEPRCGPFSPPDADLISIEFRSPSRVEIRVLAVQV